ncbi:MAG: hypothetical protein K0S24_2067 [Sphingobacterium sp.]|jgi:hypothetical protein|nr:hypothetical protein [Sphingobacterium sp.]
MDVRFALFGSFKILYKRKKADVHQPFVILTLICVFKPLLTVELRH